MIQAPTNGPAAIPRNVSAPMTPRARGRASALEEVRGRRRRDRDEDAAADRLDDAGRDQLVERLGHGRRAASRS